MKIVKQTKQANLLEALLEDSDTTTQSEIAQIDDVAAASEAELADAVQTAAEVATDGEETFSDEKAKIIAKELKTAAIGFDTAMWAPLDVRTELTDKLDDCLANAMVSKRMGTHDGVDLLVNGLPGSGKTGTVKKWARDRGVNLFYLNAKDDDLGAVLNGFPVSKVTTDEEGNEHQIVTKAFSTSLDDLDRKNSVLFLDEFNRAAPKLRAVLLTLINEHAVSGDGDDGFRYFDNLLFTVACINPAVPTDPGAMELNDAETSRFVDTMDWDSTVDNAQKYIIFHIDTLIKTLDPADPDYKFLYIRYKKTRALADTLFNSVLFEFDTRDDLLALFDERAKMLNQRSITDAIMAHGYSKTTFLNWIDKYSKFLDKNKEMIHNILDGWTEPDITVPSDPAVDTAAASDAPASGTSTNTSADENDFESMFGTDGEETDTELFGQTASAAGMAAKVSAADALNRIKNFDFTL